MDLNNVHPLNYQPPDPSDPFYYHRLELEYYLELEFGDKNQRSSNSKKQNALRKYSWEDLDEDSIDEFIDIVRIKGLFDTLLCPFCLDKPIKEPFRIKDHAIAYVEKKCWDSYKNWLNRSGDIS